MPVVRCLVVFLSGAAGIVSAAERTPLATGEILRPLGPAELPGALPGRWKVSLCALTGVAAHAWIRYENVETGEVRSASRYHVLFGGWADRSHLRWHFGPATRPGVWMDREQRIECKYRRADFVLLSTYVDNPVIYRGKNEGRGHGGVVNNCVTYARDAWCFYTGEHFELDGLHLPDDLLREVRRRNP